MTTTTIITDADPIDMSIKHGTKAKRKQPSFKKSRKKLAEFELLVHTDTPPLARGACGNQMSQDTKDYIAIFKSMPVDGYIVLPAEMKVNILTVCMKHFTGKYSVKKHEDGKSIVWIKNCEVD